MNTLIYSDENAIKAYQAYANEVVTASNLLVERFSKSYNIFNQPITEKIAFELIEHPINLFDSLLKANAPFKPVAGRDIDIQKLADLCSVPRQEFINACTIIIPGSVNQFARQGSIGIMQLKPKDKPLLDWDENKKTFILNETQLIENCEVLFKTYAKTPKQIEMVQYWQNLCDMMNRHLEKKYIPESDVNIIAYKIGLIELTKPISVGNYTRWFGIDYKKLADSLRLLN